MPHLRFHGLKKEELTSVTNTLIEKLSVQLDTPEDYFTVELSNTVFTSKEQYPFVHVLWFDRGTEQKQQVCNIITDFLIPFNYSDITVYFEDLVKENYFENKEHF